MNIVQFLTLFLVVLVFANNCLSDESVHDCPCADEKGCVAVNDWSSDSDNTEVIIINNGTRDYAMWLWESFTTVIKWNSSSDNQLMCYSHVMGKKYGFYLKEFVDFTASLDTINYFINTSRKEIQKQRADVVALNLLDLLGNCDNAGEHVDNITYVTATAITGIKNNSIVKVLCVMPWEPPCYNSDCTISPKLAELCDAIILSPDSYNTYCEESCIAKATVPYYKIIIGLVEYLAVGFKSSQILLGIPWHGYNYTCDKGNYINGTKDLFLCHLKKDKRTCDLEGSRQHENIDLFIGDSAAALNTKNYTYSLSAHACWKVDVINGDKNDTVSYMTWFENTGSLLAKYNIIQQYKLKGCVIFTGDDLTETKVALHNDFNSRMWAWLLHSMLSTNSQVTSEQPYNYAVTVAAVGVCLFALGCVLGLLISCIIFRQRKKLKRQIGRAHV